jgi:ATP-dependent Clp protease, protease subunit
MNTPDFSEAIRAKLFAERVISLFGPLTDAAATDAAAQLWTLDATGDAPVTMLLSCSGGSVRATLALLDALDVVEVEVHVTCLGAVEGPPVGVLAGCSIRRAAPSTRFGLRDDEASIDGSYESLRQSADVLFAERSQLLERIAASTGGRRSLGDLVADFEKGRTLSAAEAVDYGLIDEVVPDTDRVVALRRQNPGIGFKPK